MFTGGLPHGSTEAAASSTPPSTPTQSQETLEPVSTPTASSSSSSTTKNKRHGSTHSLTIIHGKTTTVLEMKSNIISFVTLCESPFEYDFGEPFAVLVLLSNDLMLVDLMG